MKAIAINDFGGKEKLHFQEFPTPMPSDNEVLIQIHYAGVNPVDWKIREGYLKKVFPCQFPLIPGWEVSGKVAAVGQNVNHLKIGTEVFAYIRKPLVQWGAYAEYVTFEAVHVAIKPKKLTFAEAASFPLAALTAWQALFDFAHLKKGETILIHAGAGGVGSFAIQLAKYAGAKILTTASSVNHDYVKNLGAEYPIDYQQKDFVQAARASFPEGLDVVLDSVGGPTLQKSLDLLKPGGRLVSIVEKLNPVLQEKHRILFGHVFVSPSGEQLKILSTLIEQGHIVSPALTEFPLGLAGEAQELNRQGHTRGKIVLKVI